MLILILMFISYFVSGNVLVLKGTYCGANLYLQNPISDTGHCIYRVEVNGKQVSIDTLANAIEVNLSNINLEIGDSVEAGVYHHEDCLPHALAPMHATVFGCGIMKPINITSLECSPAGLLTWTNRKDTCQPVFIQQFRWNTWIWLDEVWPCEGDMLAEEYSVDIRKHLHSGINKFRLCKQLRMNEAPIYTGSVEIESHRQKVDYLMSDNRDTILFSDTTMYKLIDHRGHLLEENRAIKLDISELKPGKYFINYDNTTDSFQRKRRKG